MRAAAVGLTAALLVAPVIAPAGVIGAADAASGTWGPGATFYDNGLVCRSGPVRSALVSWPDNAFALDPVQSGGGHQDVPAVGGVGVPVQPSAGGLDAASAAEIAYLIDRHGNDASSAVVAEVAAGVLQLAGSGAAEIDSCLARGFDGATQAATSELVDEAGRFAGPYTVDLYGPATPTASGQPIPLVAHVSSATGYPVPGLAVTLSASDPGIRLTSGSVTTDANGDVHAQAIAPTDRPVTNPTVTASVQGVAGLVETSAADEVPLVRADSPRAFTDSIPLSVNTVPDPKLTLNSAQSVLLTGGDLSQTLGVTGMNGHAGTATVSLYGPLALPSGGCAAHPASDWAAARAAGKIVAAPQIAVPRDGSYAVGKATGLSPGCYQAVAKLQTTDATPNVSAAVVGDDVSVVPVSVSAAPEHDGLAPAGVLQTTLRATSGLAATWQDVHGRLLGPRLASAGTCPTTGWTAAASAGAVDSTGTSTSSTGDGTVVSGGSATASSTPASGSGSDTAAVAVASTGSVTAAGCYAFALTATLELPGIGSTTVTIPPGEQSSPVHVITPVVSVSRLTRSGVNSGGRVSALVNVDASDGQPGSLSLQLLRLPYTYQGCFGADWQRATVVDTVKAPSAPTRGDNTYRVSSASVPGAACWTVVPVFTARANPAVRAQATAGADPMLAFTSRERPASDALASSTPRVGSGVGRQLGVGIALLALLAVLFMITGIAARRGRRREMIDPRDRLLS